MWNEHCIVPGTKAAPTTTITSIANTTTTTTANRTFLVDANESARVNWLDVGTEVDCDQQAGERYLESSSGKVPDLERCKQSCRDNGQCQSITYFESGWCSHYSTPCSKTTPNHKALISLWLIGPFCWC